MTLTLTSKLPRVGTTIFTVMSRLAAEHGAINLSQGFPDFDPPARLVDLVAEHMRGGHNQYAPMAGWPALRQQIVGKVREYYGATVDAETEVTVTSGGTEALFAAIQAVVRPGDEVIVLDPAYDSYEPAVELAGGVTVHVPLGRPDFAVDWDRVRDAITAADAAVDRQHAAQPERRGVRSVGPRRAGRIVERHGRIRAVRRGLRAHGVRRPTASQPARPPRACGAQLRGLLVRQDLSRDRLEDRLLRRAGPRSRAEFRKVHQFVQFAVATPLQAGLADFLRECPEHARELPAFYQRKRDHFAAALAQTRFRFRPSAGTYFQLADYSGAERPARRRVCPLDDDRRPVSR